MSADARTVVFATTAAASFDPAAAEPAAVHAAIATVAPQVQMAPLDVGTVAVGTPSPTWYVGVRNVGPTPFVPATIVSSNPDFAVVGGTCQLGMAIVAGESCQVHVVLTPRAAGPEAGVLTVSEAGFGATSVRGSLAGGGGVGALGALDAGHDFGSARVGAATAATTLQVANTGYGTVQLAGVDVLGEAAADFTVTATTCRDALAVGATCTVDVAFRPTVGGQRIATVRVTGDTGEYAAMIVAGAGAYSSATLATADGPGAHRHPPRRRRLGLPGQRDHHPVVVRRCRRLVHREVRQGRQVPRRAAARPERAPGAAHADRQHDAGAERLGRRGGRPAPARLNLRTTGRRSGVGALRPGWCGRTAPASAGRCPTSPSSSRPGCR